jgi:hypothetical protein
MFLNRAVTVVYKPNEWVLVRPLVYGPDGKPPIEVPARFITDLASVPGVLRALPGFNPNGLSREPAILHDFAYCMWGDVARKTADKLFYEALLSVGVSKPVAYMHYLGVRVGGWRYWGERRRKKRPESYDLVPEDEFKKLVDYYA